MALIIDPDDLNQGVEVTIDTANRTIGLNVAGNLSADGVTIKALYSFLKEEQIDDSGLPRFLSPMSPITDEFYQFVNGWNLADIATRRLVRRGGWLVLNGSGNVTEHWAAAAILQAEADDQIYYDIGNGATSFVYPGNTAEAVQVISDPNGDGSYADGFNLSTDLKVYNRQQGQLFSSASTLSNGESTLLAPKLFSLAVPTGADLKISANDATVSTTAPYTGMSITYIPHQNQGTWASATVYAANDVVQSASGRWFITAAGGTSAGNDSDLGGGSDTGVTWTAFSGERQIGSAYYAFGVIINGNNGTLQQIYEFVQYMLRQNADIDAGSGTVIGQLAPELLTFPGGGSTLRTIRQPGNNNGVYVDGTQPADGNSIEFVDDEGEARTNPFTSVVTLIPNQNLQDDPDARYFVFFTDANGNQFNTSSAILVQNNSGVDVTGTIGGAASIQFDFDYDGNTQGGRTPGTDADITVVALGLAVAQNVVATGTITRSTENVVSLVAPRERNYANAA